MTTPATSRDVEVLSLSDPLVANLCWGEGGDDLSTAFVTCSATGHLVAIEWPRPGLALAFSGAVAG